MSDDNITLPSTTGGPQVATDKIGGRHFQLVLLAYGPEDSATRVESANPLPVAIFGAVEIQNDAGNPVGVSGNVAVSNFPAGFNILNFPGTQPISAVALPLPAGAATEGTLGTQGSSPPTIAGTGIQGYLRALYDKFNGSFVNVDVTDQPDRVMGYTGARRVYGGIMSSDNVTLLPVLHAPINASSAGANTLVAANATKRIVCVGYKVVLSADVTVKFQAAGSDLTGPMELVDNSGIQEPICEYGYFETPNTNQALQIHLSAAVQVGGYLSYILV